MNTEFASPERSNENDLFRQSEAVKKEFLTIETLNSLPIFVTILNEHRQIIFANKTILDHLKISDPISVIGKRPGEALCCLHAFESEGGCGTTEFCRYCGAVNAILLSQDMKPGIKECRITQFDNNVLDFLVWANPISIDNENMTLFAITDISDEKRRKALERIFFHDVMNTAGGLRGFLEIINEASPEEIQEYTRVALTLSDKLIEELSAQRELIAAENNELAVNYKPFSTTDILNEIQLLYSHHDVAKEKNIVILNDAADILIVSDKTLMRRIIGNLVKNALEATENGGSVTLNCTVNNNSVSFTVHNKSFMPRNVQMQVFQRSFSTKGGGRGLGTYSIKLITERYLHGNVSFKTSEIDGTTFIVTYPIEPSMD